MTEITHHKILDPFDYLKPALHTEIANILLYALDLKIIRDSLATYLKSDIEQAARFYEIATTQFNSIKDSYDPNDVNFKLAKTLLDIATEIAAFQSAKILNPRTANSRLTNFWDDYGENKDGKISMYRVTPERYEGKKINGFIQRVPISMFKDANAFIEYVADKHGGNLWDFRLCGPAPHTKHNVYIGSTRCEIFEEPKV